MEATKWLLGVASAALFALPAFAATANLIDSGGRQIGRAELTQLRHAVLIRIEATGLPPGLRAVHLHRVGVCSGPDFRSADVHFDPHNRRHGHGAEGGPHAGDLPNLHVAANGEVKVEFLTSAFTLEELLDADGAALVIHAKADDYRSHPSGESGDRIACGEFRR
jgi:superoxide dismutase, Cu-Zn family